MLKVTIDQANFDRIKSTTQFIRLMHLCRYANQLRFAFSHDLTREASGSPADVLIRFNGFFVAGAVMYEALSLIPSLANVFHSYPASQEFKAIHEDPSVVQFCNRYLTTIRNKLVFHVDRQPIRDTLKWVEFEEYVLASVDDENAPEFTFFNLADDIASNFLMGDFSAYPDGNERQRAVLEDVLKELSSLIIRFNKATYNLTYQYASDNGFVLNRVE